MKSRRVKISVIMPAYNAEAFIDRAVQSVLAQKGISFELLIGDDGSTDDTWKRLNAYQNRAYVRVFRFPRNRGVGAMSNYLIAQAKGMYLSSCDADDVMLAGNLRTLARVLDKKPAVGVVYGDLLVKAGRGNIWTKRRFMPFKSWDILGGCFAKGGTLMRRSLVKKVGGYRPGIPFLEDCDLFLRLSEVTQFSYVPGKPLYRQQKLLGSLSDQSSKQLRKVSQDIFRNAIERRYGYQVKW